MPIPSRPSQLSTRLLHFSLLFCSVFIAYGTSEILQSSLYSSGGYMCLLVVYAAFLLSSLTAPLLVHKIGPLPTLWRCAVFYALIVLVSIFGSGVPNWLRLTTCASVGLAGGGFWNAQAAYVSRLSQEYATSTGVSLSSALSRFTSIFFIVFSSAQVLSQLLSSAILSGFGPHDIGVAVTALFSILFIFSTCGTLGLACLAAPEDPGSCVFRAILPCCGGVRASATTPPLSSVVGVGSSTTPTTGVAEEKKQGEGEGEGEGEDKAVSSSSSPSTSLPPPTPTQVLLFLLSQPPLLATLPLCFYGGGSLGFVLGPFLGSFSSVKVGVSNVGFVSAAYNFTNIVCAYPIDALCRTPWVGRRWVFVGAFVAHALWLSVAAALLTGYGGLATSTSTGSGSGSSGGGGSGSGEDYALVFGVIVLYGTVAPVFQSQLPALLQTWYPSPRDSSCAIAVYRVMFSLGFIAAQGISLGYAASGCGGGAASAIVGDPCLGQQSTIWACIVGLSGVGLAWLHIWGGKQVE
jgi:MFS family permease